MDKERNRDHIFASKELVIIITKIGEFIDASGLVSLASDSLASIGQFNCLDVPFSYCVLLHKTPYWERLARGDGPILTGLCGLAVVAY